MCFLTDAKEIESDSDIYPEDDDVLEASLPKTAPTLTMNLMDEDVLQNMPDFRQSSNKKDGSREIIMQRAQEDNQYVMKVGPFKNQRSVIKDRGLPTMSRSQSLTCFNSCHGPTLGFSSDYEQPFVTLQESFQEKRQPPPTAKGFSSLCVGPGFTPLTGIDNFEQGLSCQSIQASAPFPFSQHTLGPWVGFQKCTQFCHCTIFVP